MTDPLTINNEGNAISCRGRTIATLGRGGWRACEGESHEFVSRAIWSLDGTPSARDLLDKILRLMSV